LLHKIYTRQRHVKFQQTCENDPGELSNAD